MTKLYAQEKQVFDINKVTVVGNLTITSDGIASGFKSYNSGDESYLTLPTVFNPQDKPWKIIIKATMGEWISGAPYESLLGTGIQGRDNQGIALALGGSNTIACWLGSTGTSWDIGTIRTNLPYISGKTYYFKVEFTGTKYVLSVSEDNINWEIKGSIESTTPIYVSAQPLTIGDNKYNNIASTCWTGSIDLMETYIYIDNEVFFNPTKPVYSLERRKEGFDLSKFTVVGSPTITEAGVASGFTLDNYLTASQTLDLSKPFKICMGFLHKDVTKQEALMSFNGGIWENYLLVNHFSYGDTLPFYLRFEDNTTASMTVLNYVLKDNTFYYVEFLWDGSVYTLRVSENNKDWGEATYTSSKALYGYSSINTICIGKMIAKNYYPFETGLIDLPSISITVDGKEVFTGAKEKFYAMRGM